MSPMTGKAAVEDPTTFDAIVVGGGLAGLAAGVAMAQAGRSVALLDKYDVPGGSSQMSGGWFAFSGTAEQECAGIDDDAALFFEDMRVSGEGRADDMLLHAYIERQDEAYRFLRSLGLTASTVKISSGQSRARSHQFDVHRLLDLLREMFESTPSCRIITGRRAERLLTDAAGSVCGVRVAPMADSGHDGSSVVDLTARGGVVLATGGFSRSTALLEIFAPEQLAGIPYGGRGCTGDGLTMAWRLGAGFRDMGYIAGTYGSHPDTGEDEHELLTAFYMGAIIVNEEGRRFVDESDSYKKLGTACLTQTNGLGFQVFDAVVRSRSMPGVPLSDIDHLARKGRLVQASTVADLARNAGVDPDNLVSTVERYNAGIAAGEDEFGRTGLCNGVGDLVPVAEPPFYAYPAKTLMTSTYCGLNVTADAAVLAVDGSVIPGLYAAGEVVGGFHGTAYMTGTALAKALIFGRAAGAEIVARTGQSPEEKP
jgi:fumarate reductase flavoprotein subunit